MSIDHTLFFKTLKDKELPHGAYLFQGEEEHVKRSALAHLRNKVLPEGLAALCETVLDNPPADDIIAAAETVPMAADRRLVIVRDSTLLVSGRTRDELNDSKRLGEYLPKLPAYTLLLFYCHGNVDGRRAFLQTLRKHATIVQFNPLNDVDLTRWMRSTLKAEGNKNIDAKQAQYLAFTSGRDLAVLTGELHKLAHYIGEREAVEAEDIDAVSTRSLECTIFQLVDVLVEGRDGHAFLLLSTMLDAGESRLGILAMILRQYRLLLTLKWMQAEGIGQAAQRERLGIPPFAFDRTQKQSRGYTLEQLKEAAALCTETDFAVKSGRIREDIAIERAMLILTNKKGTPKIDI